MRSTRWPVHAAASQTAKLPPIADDFGPAIRHRWVMAAPSPSRQDRKPQLGPRLRLPEQFGSARVSPAIVAALAPSASALWPLYGTAIYAGVVTHCPAMRRLALACVGHRRSPLPPLATTDRGFPEGTRGLRWVPPGRHHTKGCQASQG